MAGATELISMRFRRKWQATAGIAVAATLLGFLFWHFDIMEISDDERIAYDDGLQAFTGKPFFPWGKVPRSKDFIVVAIDDKTFTNIKADPGAVMRYGSWPYDRVFYADALDFLADAKVKAVVFDAILDEGRSDPRGDMALGDTIRAHGLPFYVGFNVIPLVSPLPKVEHPENVPMRSAPEKAAAPEPADAGEETFPEEETFPGEESFPSDTQAPDAGAAQAAVLLAAAQAYAFPVVTTGGVELERLKPEPVTDDFGHPTGKAWPRYPVPTIEPVRDAVSGYGLVVVEEDDDGKMRRTRFAYTDGINDYVTLPVAVAADLLGAKQVTFAPGVLTIGDKRIRIDQDGSASIKYGGPLFERYQVVSIFAVIQLANLLQVEAKAKEDGLPPDPTRQATLQQWRDIFRGRIVFIAGTALGTADVKATPYESSTPGVAKQLATLDNLLSDDLITDAPLWVSLLLTFLTCFGSAGLVLVVRSVWVDIGWPVLLYTGFFLLTGSLLVITDIHVLTAMPGLAGTLASVLATAWDRVFSDRQRDRLKQLFSHYMEHDLLEKMVESDELPKLDGENMRVTAFFSDIRGFSTFSELYRDTPKELMRVLNRYLSTVTPELTGEGACIDKYIGDAVVAIFGAPVRHEDHALRAVRGALKVQAAIGKLREEFRKQGLPDVYTRVGVNTDTMLVGNIGSEQLLDYTAVGDGMNLAARLEATNKEYGTLILIGENTYLDVKKHVVAREVDEVRVPGKKNSSRIYELLGMKDEVPALKLKVLAGYAEALALYRARQFGEALGKTSGLLALDPEDGPSQTLRNRCARFMQSPPPPEWDGVTELHK